MFVVLTCNTMRILHGKTIFCILCRIAARRVILGEYPDSHVANQNVSINLATVSRTSARFKVCNGFRVWPELMLLVRPSRLYDFSHTRFSTLQSTHESWFWAVPSSPPSLSVRAFVQQD